MAIEYTWTIAQLERNTADDFVTIVHYSVTAVDDTYTASTYGTVGYTQESETFIPFADLTEATVVGWVKESHSVKTQCRKHWLHRLRHRRPLSLLLGCLGNGDLHTMRY
jgi:hypothetical protein